jgi:hypothetical protein
LYFLGLRKFAIWQLAHLRSRVIVRFSVLDPVGKNKRTMLARGRIILTPEARAFMDRVALLGRSARNRTDWPRNPHAAKSVRLSVVVFNTRHDAAASSPLIADALEGVFYANDRIVSYAAQDRPVKDIGKRRVEIEL